MHLALLVRVLQPEADLIGDRNGGTFAIATERRLGDQVFEVPLREGHDEPGRVVGRVEQGHHVRVVDVPEYLDFSSHTGQRIRVALRPLEGDYRAFGSARASPEDLRVATFA